MSTYKMTPLEFDLPAKSRWSKSSTFECIDAHTCGNPVRVVISGGPELEGNSMKEKRLDFIKNHDWIRRSLVFEPRGHDLMSGSILYPPHNPEHDFSVLFIETSGCLPMCGHGLIGTVTVVLQENLIIPKSEGVLHIDTPAGLVKALYTKDGNKIQKVKLINIPSFLFKQDIKVTIDELGELSIDIAYGGNFYAIVDIQQSFTGIDDYTTAQLINWATVIKQKINEAVQCIHPMQAEINSCSHVLFSGKTLDKNADARNAVVYGEKAIDRSPCGTGTSARMAQWFSKGRLREKETFVHESIIGTKFTGMVESLISVNEFKAIIPSIEGCAKVIAYHTIFVDQDDDPLALGFQLI